MTLTPVKIGASFGPFACIHSIRIQLKEIFSGLISQIHPIRAEGKGGAAMPTIRCTKMDGFERLLFDACRQRRRRPPILEVL